MKLILAGPYAQKTKTLNGIRFINGVAILAGEPEHNGGLLRYMEKCYQAYPEGHSKLIKNQNGISESKASTGPGTPEPVPSNAGPDGDQASQASATDSEQSASTQGGTQGSGASGDGSKDPRASEEEQELTAAIKIALTRLSSDDDSHWTSDGKPAVDAVSTLSGKSVTRKMINAINKQFNRAASR